MMDATTPGNSDLLRARMTMCTGPLDAVFSRLWADSNPGQMIPAFLVMLHQIMRASVPVMEAAIRRCDQIGGGDPLTGPLARYYAHHIVEERNHDIWALEDLVNAGFDAATALRQVPSPDVARLAGAQRYWVEHHHPLMLLGCILVLESFPPDERTIDDMRDASGLPEAAFRTMRLHGKLDTHHSTEAFAVVDSLPMTRHDMNMIATSLMACMESLTMCILNLRPVQW